MQSYLNIFLLVAAVALAKSEWEFPKPFQPSAPRAYGYQGSLMGSDSLSTRNANYSLNVGFVGPYDSLLFSQWYSAPSRFFSVPQQKVNITTPLIRSGYVTRNGNITAIIVKSYYDGPRGYANILAGGLGHSYVRLRLSAPRGYGYRMKVDVYGR